VPFIIDGPPEDEDITSGVSSSGQGVTGSPTPGVAAGATVDPEHSHESTSGEDGMSKLAWRAIPNVMGDYEQATYHFELYLLHDTNPNEANKIIIAESGATALNIQEVLVEAYVGPQIRTRNANAYKFTIKIYEPYGANLPDKLVSAASEMRLRNYLKAPWMLKLRLHGYNASGDYTEIGEGPWVWQLMFTDITSAVSEAGSMHTITAIPYPEVALQNQYALLSTFTNTGGETVGDVLQAVVDTMNRDAARAYLDENFIKYKIEDRPYVGGDSYGGIANPFAHRIIGSNPQLDADGEITGAQFSSGTDITAIVDNLFSASETAVKQAMLSRSLSIQDAAEVAKAVSVMHRIDTEVKITGYSAVLGDYRKEITFVVRPYDSLRLITSSSGAQGQNDDVTVGARRLRHAIKKAFFQKQYDFIFTGKNTEVIKFDINLNFRWSIVVPPIWGRNNSDGAPDPTRIDKQSQLAAARTEAQEATAAADAAATLAMEDGISDEEQMTRQRRANTFLADRDAAVARGTALAAEINAEEEAAAASEAEEEGTLEGSSYADDLSMEMVQVGQRLPTTWVHTLEGNQNNQGGRRENHELTKSVYGTLLNQLYGSFDGNLQTIELDVRGDPYWLGQGQYGFYNGKGSVAVHDENTSTEDRPNMLNGEHMFVFNFRIPQGYDESTGTVLVKPSESYTGFYAVSKLVHSFSNGLFSQSIQAYRVPGMHADQILKATDEAGNEYEVLTVDIPEVSEDTSPAPGNRGAGQAGGGNAAAPAARGRGQDAVINTLDPRLQQVVRQAQANGAQFEVVSGRRTQAEQDGIVAGNNSNIRNSRHLTGQAFDLVPVVNGRRTYDVPNSTYVNLSNQIKAAAGQVGVPITWGGNFSNPRNAANERTHYELRR
jgi:peptidoglycan L-alanyl-D-glutamate endopeptidase CwlK